MSVMVSVPVCAPAAEGSKNTLMVQPTPTARLEVQPLLVPNCALVWMLDMFKATSPLLVSVIFSGSPVVPTNWPGKVRLEGERLATGAMQVPESAIDCGLSEALSTRETVAVLVPRAVGVKVTLTWQEAFTANELPQFWLKLKSPMSAPVSEMLLMLRV